MPLVTFIQNLYNINKHIEYRQREIRFTFTMNSDYSILTTVINEEFIKISWKFLTIPESLEISEKYLGNFDFQKMFYNYQNFKPDLIVYSYFLKVVSFVDICF